MPRRVSTCVTQHAREKLRCMVMLLLACAPLAHLTAQDIERVETELTAEVRVEVMEGANRVVRFVPATVLSQGEVVYYTLKIRNPSAQYLRNVVVTQRIPANTAYVEGSASGPAADVSFSIDGGQTFAPSDALRRVDASGVERPVPGSEYTHIRWRLRYPLAPGAVALARFRAVFQ